MDITASSKHQQSLFSLLFLLYVETLEICVGEEFDCTIYITKKWLHDC